MSSGASHEKLSERAEESRVPEEAGSCTGTSEWSRAGVRRERVHAVREPAAADGQQQETTELTSSLVWRCGEERLPCVLIFSIIIILGGEVGRAGRPKHFKPEGNSLAELAINHRKDRTLYSENHCPKVEVSRFMTTKSDRRGGADFWGGWRGGGAGGVG